MAVFIISKLFQLYRVAPFWIRDLIGHLTWPLRLLMQCASPGITLGGYQMSLDFTDNASFKYYADRNKYEAAEIRLFLSCIIANPEACVIDIGANYGAYTLAAANLVRFGVPLKIIAIEPDYRPFAALNRSIEYNGFGSVVELHQAIVTDHSGQESLYLNARSSADNRSVAVTSAPITIRSMANVACTTIDQLVAKAGVPARSRFIVKMDIQGNEPRALAGMCRTLGQADGFILFFEHCRYLIDSAKCDMRDYRRVLQELGAEEFYEISPVHGVLRLNGISGLFGSFEALEARQETKMQGAAADYILCRNLRTGDLLGLGGGQR